jgi:hypothetical protein
MTNTPIDTSRDMCIIGGENTRCGMITRAKRHRLEPATKHNPVFGTVGCALSPHRFILCQKWDCVI